MDGQPLGEKNPKWMQDDYVKFLRFAQWKIHKAGQGVVGMITNHSYLDNPTFRGMRQSLMKTFNEITILNLHGNSLKKETTPDGGKDENVFDIRQGVAIVLFVKEAGKTGCAVTYTDLYGLRESKYSLLDKPDLGTFEFEELSPVSPWHFFIPRNTEAIEEYLLWSSINQIFPVSSVGIVTARDKFAVAFNQNELNTRVLQFRNPDASDELIRNAYGLKDTKSWKLCDSRASLTADPHWEDYFQRVLYRPFDVRHIYYSEKIIDRPRYEVMRHMLEGENLALMIPKQFKERPGAFISTHIGAHKTVSAYDINYLFPLYLYENADEKNFARTKQEGKQPNLNPILTELLEKVLGEPPSPETLLHYIYAVFYSNTYREKYAEYLKIDFPRVPFTKNIALFQSMAALGQRLTALHLLKSDELNTPIVRFEGTGTNDTVEKITYDETETRVYLNKNKYFDGITPEMWNYHIGGYQVLHKYLKDRKGRAMDDPRRYCRIATAIHKTMDIQVEIDAIFPQLESTVIEDDLSTDLHLSAALNRMETPDSK